MKLVNFTLKLRLNILYFYCGPENVTASLFRLDASRNQLDIWKIWKCYDKGVNHQLNNYQISNDQCGFHNVRFGYFIIRYMWRSNLINT